MHTHCTNVSFLVLILHYNYVRYNQWRKMCEGTTGPLCTIFAASVNL